jgi:hypothetical protein
MENIYDKDKKSIGAKVKNELADEFTAFCKNKYNQRVLFPNLVRWFMDLKEPIQWLIYWGKFEEAHGQIAESFVDDAVSAAEDADAKPKRKKAKHRSKTA